MSALKLAQAKVRPGFKQLFRGAVVGVLALLSVSTAQADVTGTDARIMVGGSEALGNTPVGSGTEFDLGVGIFLLDIDPSNQTITVTVVDGQTQWSIPSLTVEFSGGVLTQIQTVTSAGGTASNAGSYSATVSSTKAITINMPSNTVDTTGAAPAPAGTIVFSFTSLPASAGATPTVSSVSVPSNATRGIGANLDFTVKFSTAVTVTGTPQIGLSFGSGTRAASYVSGSGSTDLLFRYTVTAGDFDSDGVAVGAALSLNGGTIRSGGADAVLSLNSVGGTGGVLVDGVRPTASLVVAGTSFAVGWTSDVTITFSEPVTGFTNADLEIANGTMSAVSTADGGYTWTAVLTPTASISDASNVITLSLSGVSDAAGNAGTGTTDSNNYRIDTARPTAGLVVADNSLAVGETSLVTITFSEPVTGFSNADLTIPNGTLSAVSTSDNITYSATLSPTAGITDASNVITLTNSGVADAAGNAGSGTTDSNNYSIDTARPTVLLVVSDSSLLSGETSPVTITFSEAVTGFDNTDLTIPNGTLTSVTSSDNITWTATFTPAVGIDNATNVLTLNMTGVVDTNGNAGTGTANSTTYAVHTARPTGQVVLANDSMTAAANDGTSLVTITFSEAVTGLTTADLTFSNGTLSSLDSADGGVTWTTTFTPTVGMIANSNTITLDLTGVTNASGNAGTGTAVSANFTIDLSALLTLTSVAPTSGSTAGGTTVTLTGTNLMGATSVTFDGTVGTGLNVVDATTVTIVTPAHTAGAVDVAITTPDGTATAAAAFTYTALPAPVLSSLTPTNGSTAGGTTVTLTGTDLTGATGVTFDGAAGTNLVVNSATSVSITTPAHAAGAVDIEITTPGGTGTATAAFTYTAAATPTLSSVAPVSGGVSGGTLVTLTGTNLTGATAVTFDGSAGTGLVVLSATSATVTTPAHAAGAVDVAITTPGGTATATASFTYSAASVVVFEPASGRLDDAMAKEDYSQTFLVAGGSAYHVSGGALPPGLVGQLSANGILDGTLDAGSEGTYHFTITATVGGAPVSATYDLLVLASTVTAPNKTVQIPPGSTPVPVNLTVGATGGEFSAAILGTVTPPQAGTAEITMGDVASIDTVWSQKFYLKFHPNPAYGGSVVIGYTLIGATGSSSATVTFIASLDPNGVANNFDHLLKDFVRTRASLLANGVDTPGLRQRRGMSSGTSPGTINISPSDSSVSMNFASSLLELKSWGEAGNAAETLAEGDPATAQPFNFWIDGSATLHLRSDDGDEHWGRFALVSVGGDYLVNDKLLVGLALHADFMDDIATDTTVEGTGMLIGPYVSAEIVDGVFLDASLYYGHSWNEVTTSIFDGSFETDRLLAKASLEGQWALSEALTLRPKASVFYLHETTGQYTVADGDGNAITIAGFDTDQFRLSAGGTLEYQMDLGEGLSITPFFGAQLGLSLTQHDEAVVFTTLTTGFDLTGLGSWTLGGTIEADLESDSLKAVSAKANLRAGF